MYSTVQDILSDLPENEVINLCNDEKRSKDLINFSNPNDAVVKRVVQAIKDADDEINGYLRSKYTLPLNSIPNRLTKICKDITIYNLYKRRHPVETPYRDEYTSRISELRLIKKGDVILDVGNPVEESRSYTTNKTKDDRMFPKQLAGY